MDKASVTSPIDFLTNGFEAIYGGNGWSHLLKILGNPYPAHLLANPYMGKRTGFVWWITPLQPSSLSYLYSNKNDWQTRLLFTAYGYYIHCKLLKSTTHQIYINTPIWDISVYSYVTFIHLADAFTVFQTSVINGYNHRNTSDANLSEVI